MFAYETWCAVAQVWDAQLAARSVLDGAGEPVGVIWEESDGLGYFRMGEKT